jgi:GT2 family glycosyltransferase
LSIRVSVVVPTYKRPNLLRNCLSALVRQTFPHDQYEIIIVDDAGSDDTRGLAENFSPQTPSMEVQPVSRSGPEAGCCPRIRYAATTLTHGPAAARNLGWRMAHGEIIAFTDDDCLPEPDWLQEGVAALTDDFAGVSGKVIVPVSKHPSDYENNVAHLEQAEFVTANCFYRRAALEATGGFDERFTMAWREDSDIQFRLLTLGYLLGSAPTAQVVHPVRAAPWGVSIKEQRKSMYEALLYKKYPELYRKMAHSSAPVHYYAIIFFTVEFLIAVWIGNQSVAWVMVGAWLGSVLHFTYRRLKNTKHTPSHILEMLLTSAVIPYLSVFWRLYGAFYFRVFFF